MEIIGIRELQQHAAEAPLKVVRVFE